MKKIIFVAITSIIMLFYSCINEVALPVKADFIFEIVNRDYTVPVQVKISNYTEGADTYNWTFIGGVPETSSSKNPGTIVYERSGEYVIRLEASNRDGSIDTQEVTINIKTPVNINFTAEIIENNFSPVTVKLTNTTEGATSYNWSFEGGNPASSNEKNPQDVVFTTPGEHTITLKVSNGDESYTQQEIITVKPYLVAEFNYEVAFQDDDLQVPVTITTANNSISATSFEWTVTNGTPQTTKVENPTIVFSEPGTHTIQLKATNGKEEKIATKTITVVENTNLREFKDVKLGINTAHKNGTVGSFFSTITRKTYTQNEVTNEISKTIDIVFFGLDDSFTFNKFVSPDEAENNSFTVIPNANKTIFINKLEDCNCTDNLSVAEFDEMQNDEKLVALHIEETTQGKKDFDNTTLPRIVLFKTQKGRKGAIKIKEFVNNGINSYIRLDIKVQKEAR